MKPDYLSYLSHSEYECLMRHVHDFRGDHHWRLCTDEEVNAMAFMLIQQRPPRCLTDASAYCQTPTTNKTRHL